MMNWPEDPWEHLEVPNSDQQITSRRVDPDHTWDFFWARNRHNHLLVLQHNQDIKQDRSLPNFRGFKVSNVPTEMDNRSLLIFELLEPEHLELFQRLCFDVVTSTVSASDQKSAVEMAIGRTWRWHHLLRGGKDDRLTIDAQRGLIGELLTIVDVLEPIVGIEAAVTAWTRPTGSPKDFELGSTCIEVKARRSASRSQVRITSEYQLDLSDIKHLYLVIRDVDRVSEEIPEAKTLPQYIESVVRLTVGYPEHEEGLNARLAALGFRWEDDYSDAHWSPGKRRVYQVSDTFPRLSPGTIPQGINEVTYSVDMETIRQYETTLEQLEVADDGSKS